MLSWLHLLQKVRKYGHSRPDRTGTGTLSLFAEQVTFNNFDNEFPAVTTKKLAFGQVCAELACFLRGYDNLEQFHMMGCTIWDGNGDADYWTPHRRWRGDLGRIYGVQWRDWQSVVPARVGNGAADVKHTDQLANLVKNMRMDPFGRRHIVTALNPGETDQMCLPPCHVLFQAYVRADPYADPFVDLRVDMRSVDLFLGLPFDIASYAVLQRLLAKELGLRSGYLTFQLGDAHIYKNHLEQVNTVLARTPLPPPRLELADGASLFDFNPSQAKLVGYDPHPAVPAPLNV